MNIVVIGSTTMTKKIMKSIYEINSIVSLVGLLTIDEFFRVSWATEQVRNSKYCDLEAFSSKFKIPVLKVKKNMNDPKLLQQVIDLRPDMFLVAGWYHKIPKNWLEVTPAYGLHSSLLPHLSGGAPLVWAMINNEKMTGVTFFELTENIDSGPILGQSKEKIKKNDTIKTLNERIENKAAKLVKKIIIDLAHGRKNLSQQNEKSRTKVPQREPKDGLIDWSWSVNFIDRFIRAQTRPYPGAFFYIKKTRVTVWCAKSRKIKTGASLGSIRVLKNGNIGIACKDGVIELQEIQIGKNALQNLEIREFFAKSVNSTILNNLD